jgi:TonB family protein
VHLELTVNTDGRVRELRVLGGHPLFADAAVRCVKEWRFETAAVESKEAVEINFHPEEY